MTACNNSLTLAFNDFLLKRTETPRCDSGHKVEAGASHYVHFAPAARSNYQAAGYPALVRFSVIGPPSKGTIQHEILTYFVSGDARYARSNPVRAVACGASSTNCWRPRGAREVEGGPPPQPQLHGSRRDVVGIASASPIHSSRQLTLAFNRPGCQICRRRRSGKGPNRRGVHKIAQRNYGSQPRGPRKDAS